jgi:hypothetical protein
MIEPRHVLRSLRRHRSVRFECGIAGQALTITTTTPTGWCGSREINTESGWDQTAAHFSMISTVFPSGSETSA